uniref:Uncharacterized protein n=1 Tax=Oryza rufipogon TaxID=4529 RepID=A0A0E0QQ83_ORYRU
MKSTFSLCLEACRRGCGYVTPADASGRCGWVAPSAAGADGREKHTTEDIAVQETMVGDEHGDRSRCRVGGGPPPPAAQKKEEGGLPRELETAAGSSITSRELHRGLRHTPSTPPPRPPPASGSALPMAPHIERENEVERKRHMLSPMSSVLPALPFLPRAPRPPRRPRRCPPPA